MTHCVTVFLSGELEHRLLLPSRGERSEPEHFYQNLAFCAFSFPSYDPMQKGQTDRRTYGRTSKARNAAC